jgi:hypothetical protein
MTKFAKWLLPVTLVAFASGCASMNMDSLTSMGGGSEQSNVNADDVVANQEKIVQEYVLAAGAVNAAQIKIATALDLKEQVAELEEVADVLGSGSVSDADSLEKISETSARADSEIQSTLEAGEELSSESKQELAIALIPYALGVYQVKEMSEEFQPFLESAQSAISNASMTEKATLTSKLSTGMYVAKNVPGLLTNLATTGTQLLSYAENQNIDVPDEATDALGAL